MSIEGHNLLGFYPYKMDVKCRVSIPSDWRLVMVGRELLFMQSTNEGIPTLRVLTELEFKKMLQEIEEQKEWPPAKRRKARGLVFERCVKASINDQGKLSIPKQLCEKPELVAGENLCLVGRGDYIEILSESNYQKLKKADESFEDELDVLGIF
jgi:MraZ protein